MQEIPFENTDIFTTFTNASKPKEIKFLQKVLYALEGQVVKQKEDGVKKYLFNHISAPVIQDPNSMRLQVDILPLPLLRQR